MAGEAGYVVHLHNLAAYIKLLYISKFIWKKKKGVGGILVWSILGKVHEFAQSHQPSFSILSFCF